MDWEQRLEGWKRDVSATVRNRICAISIPGFDDALRFDIRFRYG